MRKAYIPSKERHIQIDPITGKRKRGRPRGSGKRQQARIRWVERVYFDKGVMVALPIHISYNRELEELIYNKEVSYVDIVGRRVDLVLKDGSRVRVI
ncbi:MAG: hypothetical protein ACTSVF_03245 [Candidatus Asgardarchaeia archaeon]